MKDLLRSVVPTPGYYGWAVVAAGVVLAALSFPGQTFALSLFVDAWMEDLGLTRLEVSGVYSGATLAAALFLPYAGKLADRVPSRTYMLGLLLLLGLSLLALAGANGVVVLTLALVALRVLGQGAVGLGTFTTVLRWFHVYRGRALAFVALGYPLSELMAPPLLVLALDRAGWRGTVVIVAGLYLLLAWPLSRVFRERGSDDVGLDGLPPSKEEQDDVTRTRDKEEGSQQGALRSWLFWALTAHALLAPLLLTAVLFHQLALLDAFSLPTTYAAYLLGAYAVGRITSTYAGGFLIERVSPRLGLGASHVIGALALCSLPLVHGGEVFGVLVTGFFLGSWSGSYTAVLGILIPAYFGTSAAGRLKGVLSAVRNGFTAVGPPLLALLLEHTGASVSLFLLAGLPAGAALVAMALPPASDVR